MLRNKLLAVLFIFLIILIGFVYLANWQSKNLSRDPKTLFNKYYLLRNTNREAARNALKIILKQNPSNHRALKELSTMYLEEKNSPAALPLLQELMVLEPNNLQYPLQIAQIYYELGDLKNTRHYLTPLVEQNNNHFIKFQASQLLEKIASFIPSYKTYAITIAKPTIQTSNQDKPIINTIFLNWFYKLKRENSKAAEEILTLLLILEHRNPLLNQEMGYLKLKTNDAKAALPFFIVTYEELGSPQIALQIAYLYYQLGNKEDAKQYF